MFKYSFCWRASEMDEVIWPGGGGEYQKRALSKQYREKAKKREGVRDGESEEGKGESGKKGEAEKGEKPVWDILGLSEMCKYFMCIVLFNLTNNPMG